MDMLQTAIATNLALYRQAPGFRPEFPDAGPAVLKRLLAALLFIGLAAFGLAMATDPCGLAAAAEIGGHGGAGCSLVAADLR